MRRENGIGTIYKIKDRKLRKPFKVIVVTGYSLNTGNPIRKVLGYTMPKLLRLMKLWLTM